MMMLFISILILPLFSAIFSFVFKNNAKTIAVFGAFIWFVLHLFAMQTVYEDGSFYYNFAGFLPPLGIAYKIDGVATLLSTLSAFLLFCVHLYCYKSYDKPALYPLFGFLSTGLAVIFFSNDIFNLYVGLELVGLCAVALTAFTQKLQNIKAALNYFFATLLGSGFYLLGVALLYAHYGVLDIDLLAKAVQKDEVTSFVFICFALGLSLKTALFPLHYWLPEAHANAAPAISALLSALIVKASFYLLYLLYFKLFFFLCFVEVFGYLGIIAIFYGGLQALFAKNIKLLIAYSTISQLGYLFLLFLMSQSQAAHEAMLLHIIAHALAKGGLFLASGVVIYHFATKKISSIKGLGSTLPLTAFTFGLSAVTIIGLPPSLGFFAKWHYLMAAFEMQQWIVVIAVLLGGVLSASYLLKLLVLSLQTPEKTVIKDSKSSYLEWIAFCLALFSVLLGFFSHFIITIGAV